MSLSLIQDLQGAEVKKVTDSAWGPSGHLGVTNAGVVGSNLKFELLVPTSASDIWDYIWRSEKEAQFTEKVQLFQGGSQIPGSRVIAISREGQSEQWDARGPERYRLTFEVPLAAFKANVPVEVHFFWDDKVMSISRKS